MSNTDITYLDFISHRILSSTFPILLLFYFNILQKKIRIHRKGPIHKTRRFSFLNEHMCDNRVPCERHITRVATSNCDPPRVENNSNIFFYKVIRSGVI